MKILITSVNKVLSPVELTAQRGIHLEAETARHAPPKRTFPCDGGGAKGAEELQKLYGINGDMVLQNYKRHSFLLYIVTRVHDCSESETFLNKPADLRCQLLVPRIERLSGRSLATWDADEQQVLVLRKDGKFGSFGYSRNGKLYLEHFEALFLLELGRLQLEYNAMIMSVEQAYLLLLGEAATLKYTQYLVYSSLSRVGYILVKHRNQRYTERTVVVTQVDCSWALLLHAVQQVTIPSNIKKSHLYPKALEHMELIKKKIMQQLPADGQQVVPATSINFEKKIVSSTKRAKATEDLESATAAKRLCPAPHNSFVDLLQNERESYSQFQQIFDKFDIIKLQAPLPPGDVDCVKHVCALKIAFDLYLHNDGFKKSTPKAPTFQLIVLAPNAPFPTHAEITHCHRQQKHTVPLLVLSISDSKQIQAFLYYFT